MTLGNEKYSPFLHYLWLVMLLSWKWNRSFEESEELEVCSVSLQGRVFDCHLIG